MASASAVAFTPEVALPAIERMRTQFGEHLYGRYGFLDAFNPSFRLDMVVHHGQVVPGVGWFDTDYLGIDQGSIVAMIENARSELIWKTMRRNPYIVAGLRWGRRFRDPADRTRHHKPLIFSDLWQQSDGLRQ